MATSPTITVGTPKPWSSFRFHYAAAVAYEDLARRFTDTYSKSQQYRVAA
jgi:hypothetical protein